MTISDASSRMSIFLKRLFDIFLALSMLIVCIPLLLYCYWLVWHEHDGSVFFKQERIGRYGKPFMMYKFRSIQMDKILGSRWQEPFYVPTILMNCHNFGIFCVVT